MSLIKNPEIKKLWGLFCIITLFATIGAAQIQFSFGIYVLVLCVTLGILFGVFTDRRYKIIAKMSTQLDHILHSEEILPFLSDKEGELAILSSEIYKMTIRLQEQADQLKKEKSYLGESIENISHQIRTPLTSLRMIVPRLRRESLTEQQKSEYIQEINQLLTRMEWLVTALLKIAKLESETIQLVKEEILVKDVVEKALQPLEILIEVKEINIIIAIDDTVSFIGDSAWSCEAISNIVKNCIEHLPSGGTINIDAQENSIYTKIVITDSGCGIKPEDLPHLFERFYKGKNSSTENVGIGLALSRMIILQQNGTIQAGNVTPHGARFEIRFYKGAI